MWGYGSLQTTASGFSFFYKSVHSLVNSVFPSVLAFYFFLLPFSGRNTSLLHPDGFAFHVPTRYLCIFLHHFNLVACTPLRVLGGTSTEY